MKEKSCLSELLKKYKLNKSSFLGNDMVFLEHQKLNEIDDTLNYIINELKVSKSYVENFPDIIYKNKNEIKNNFEFLERKNIEFFNVNQFLQALNTENEELEKTYNYVKDKYGYSLISNYPAILLISKQEIEEVESSKIPKSKKAFMLYFLGQGINIEKSKKIINSKEFKEHPELFTAMTLKFSSLEKIQEMLNSKEFKEHPELFTSTTLIHSNVSKIKDMINSEEYDKTPELFTSQTISETNLSYIKQLLELPFWQEEKYKKLLTPSLVSKSSSMIKKLPKLFSIAEYYGIDEYLTINFTRLSPEQCYALINFFIDFDIPLITEENKLNPLFNKPPIFLKNRYNIDMNELIKKYPFKEEQFLSKKNDFKK